MIKKVKIEQLEPGVFVHDFNCDWESTNLLINQAKIKDYKIIDILASWGIREVYIDTDKGIDVNESVPILEARRDIDEGLKRIAGKKNDSIRTVPLKEELAVAKNIKKQAVSVIKKVMESVGEGKPLQTGEAYQLVDQMEKSVIRNRDALVLLTRIRKKDEYTLMHSISVGAYILNFCYHFDIPRERTLGLAVGALFHDIGKTKVPLAILNKPGKLTEEEFAVIQKHPEYSAAILKSSHKLPFEAYDMGLHHHERFDGNGYPHRLKGDEIKFGSQLAAIADVFDALTSDRCYRGKIDRVEGLRKLYEWSGHHFNKDLTHKFIQCIGVYPIGTCVGLESGRIGIVVGSTESLVQPVVHLFYDKKKKKEISIPDFDLSRTDDHVIGYEDASRFDLTKLDVFRNLGSDLLAMA
jgi:HD-GYP domain-containing protein (c-di-GMP phosphodiesterase class II)